MTTSNNKIERRNDLLNFFIITFTISWLIWLPRVLADNNLAEIPARLLQLNAFALLGPSIAAFWLTYKLGGRDAIKTLWKRGWNFRFEKSGWQLYYWFL